jgi:peroxiredoxin
MTNIVRIVVLVSMLVAGLAIAGCSDNPTPAPVLKPGSPAPDFQLKDLDGQSVSLSGLQGHPVMLNFWATSCGYCRTEMPFIQEAYEDEEWREQGLVILAVNLGDSPAAADKFMEDNGLSFTVLLDTQASLAQDYNIYGIPVTYLIDKNGIIIDRKLGPFASKAEIDWRLINSILEGE